MKVDGIVSIKTLEKTGHTKAVDNRKRVLAAVALVLGSFGAYFTIQGTKRLARTFFDASRVSKDTVQGSSGYGIRIILGGASSVLLSVLPLICCSFPRRGGSSVRAPMDPIQSSVSNSSLHASPSKTRSLSGEGSNRINDSLLRSVALSEDTPGEDLEGQQEEHKRNDGLPPSLSALAEQLFGDEEKKVLDPNASGESVVSMTDSCSWRKKFGELD